MKLVNKKLKNKAVRLTPSKFNLVEEIRLNYTHSSGKISEIDLSKEWRSCIMFDRGICEHLVYGAITWGYPLPGLEKEFNCLQIRRHQHNKLKQNDLSVSSDSDFESELNN